MNKGKLHTATRHLLICKSANLLIVLCLLLTGCLRELSADDPCDVFADNALLEVVIHWDGKDPATLPARMSIYWYPVATGVQLVSDMNRNGGMEFLPQEVYSTACFDYYDNKRLNFRGERYPGSFEVYNIPATGLYDKYTDPAPGEPTVAEAYPYTFYVDAREQVVSSEGIPPGDTLKLHFYPENVLREFTFLIYGVKGAKNMASNSGAISGMSASYFPVTGNMADKPSTILFDRVTAIQKGQSYNWTAEQKALFEGLNPAWQSTEPDEGWTDDWITGKFCTFGPVNLNSLRFRLTVEAISKDNYYYYGAWGYWLGQWDENIGTQIKGSVEGNGTGTWQERRDWWRNRNGGYDIVIYNNGRLNVPDGGGGGQPGDNGGFDVGTGPWVTLPVPVD